MKVAYDISRLQPACPLIAAALGADTAVTQHFPSESWLTAPTNEMRVYETTDEQLSQLIRMTLRKNVPNR